MIDAGFVPVYNHDDADTAIAIAEALVAGGATTVEFTNRSQDALGVFARLVEHFGKSGTGPMLGVGSIRDADSASRFIDAGAAFVVGPTTEQAVADTCSGAGVPYVPGCGTATEISRADAMGCELIKLFPGDAAGGPGFVKAIRGPMPWVRLMPTGGVDITEESLGAWFDAGVACVGLGSKLVSSNLVADADWDALTRRTQGVAQTIEQLRT